MTILQNLDSLIKDALKAKQSERLNTLRLIKTEAKNKEIELLRELNEDDFNQLLSRMVKQRNESIAQYEKAGHSDRADAEKQEITIISEFLPKPLTEDEVDALIQEAVQKTNASSPKDMGLVMKELKGPTTGRFDGKILANKVKDALAS